MTFPIVEHLTAMTSQITSIITSIQDFNADRHSVSLVQCELCAHPVLQILDTDTESVKAGYQAYLRHEIGSQMAVEDDVDEVDEFYPAYQLFVKRNSLGYPGSKELIGDIFDEFWAKFEFLPPQE